MCHLNDNTDKQINLITWFGGICVILLLLMCVIFFCRGCCIREHDGRHTLFTDTTYSSFPFKINQLYQIDDSTKESIRHFQEIIDTVQEKNQSLSYIYRVLTIDNKTLHTIVENQEVIPKNILYLNYRIDSIAKIEDNLINDVRQETNNNIDKSNTWISFWLAIMALVGVIIPWAWQLKLNKDEEKRYERLKTDLETKYKQLEKNNKDDLKKIIEAAENSKWSKELELLTSLLSKCSDHRLMEEIRGASSIEHEIWSSIKVDLKQLVEMAFEKLDGKKTYKLKDGSITTLISALTNIYDILTQEARDTQKIFNRKLYTDITDRIRIAIQNLAQRKISQTSTYYELDKICQLLDFFPLRKAKSIDNIPI